MKRQGMCVSSLALAGLLAAAANGLGQTATQQARMRLIEVQLSRQMTPILGKTNGAAGTMNRTKGKSISKVKAGWASQTGYRWAETAVQRTIVSRAIASNGNTSGQANVSQVWGVDTDNGDGNRMRRAINRYAAWYPKKPYSLAQVRAEMIGEFATSAYNASCKSQLTDRIINIYNAAAALGSVRTPTTDQETLQFLGIKKQCLEWANCMSLISGGGAKNYWAGSIQDSTAWRPGMGLFKADRSHAMIIIDINWNAQGQATQFKVAEANYANVWVNPPGMIPWLRTVGVGRIVGVGDRVINFEAP